MIPSKYDEKLNLRKLHKIIFDTNEFVFKHEFRFSEKFGVEIGRFLLNHHVILNVENVISIENEIDFWEYYDFSKLNFIDISFCKKEKVNGGFLVGAISGDFFIINEKKDIVVSTNIGEKIFTFNEFITFISSLIKLSILNYMDELRPDSFNKELSSINEGSNYRSFLKKYFDPMLN